MSLIDEAMTKVVMLEKKRFQDGEGGFSTIWEEGVEFDAAITFDTSTVAKIADSLSVTSLYTVTTNKNAKLSFHDVFKRLSDDKIFRVTSDGDDKKTLDRASFQISQVSAEEWELPT